MFGKFCALTLGIALVVSLSACGTEVVVKEKIVRVNVPVKVGCITNREGKVLPLKEKYTPEQWAQLTPSQKAGAVGSNALKRMNRENILDADLAACPDA